MKNTTFEQTVSTSKGFYIKQANKGYSEGKWVLPSVHAGGKLTVNAASGISADIKAKNGQALQGAITALAALPGTEWLNGLNSRSDVQWNTVKDAYDSWNYKSQSLNPAVAAVIAVAAAAARQFTGGDSCIFSNFHRGWWRSNDRRGYCRDVLSCRSGRRGTGRKSGESVKNAVGTGKQQFGQIAGHLHGYRGRARGL